MENLTLTDFQTTIAVILAVFAALAVIDKGVAAFKNIFGKGGNAVSKMDERLETVEDQLEKDKKRLDLANTDMVHVLNAMNAILMHEITGNGVDKLREAKNDLDAYMAKRGKD